MFDEFLNNKYTAVYYSVISFAKKRTLAPDRYSEIHHIIPKSLGGSNSKENLVQLTPKEHFICHRLLTKITSGQAKSKMIYAIRRMTYSGNKHQSERYKTNSRTYSYVMELAKKEMSQRMTLNNPMYDPVVKTKHQDAIDKRGKTTGMSNKTHTDSTKILMREKRSKQTITDSTKNKISKKIKELTNSEGYINPMHRNGVPERHLEACLERSRKHRTTCQYCERSFANNMYARFHGDKCKDKP